MAEPPTKADEEGQAPPAPPLPPLRERIGHIVFETLPGWPRRFDTILLTLIVLSVIGVMIESIAPVRARYGGALYAAEWTFTVLFTIEYALRLWVARKRLRYVFSFWGIVDLLSILPTYFGLIFGGIHSLLIIRILRLMRIFRILKIVRMSREASALGTALWGSAAKIAVFVGVVVLAATIIGALMHIIEGAENGFTSIPRSVYWAIVTLTTVGYGDISPQTEIGQVLASLVMILGYGVIAVPTGIVSAEIISMRGVRRVCTECPLTDHAHDATFCRGCGSVLDLSRVPS